MRLPKQCDKIVEYENLSLVDKRKKLGKEIAEMTYLTEDLIHDLSPTFEVKPIEEYDNLFDANLSEEKYLDGLYEDLLDLQEVMGLYFTTVTNNK